MSGSFTARQDGSLPCDSRDAYAKKYEGGYGLNYPDGHVIRFYERILKHRLSKTKGNLLDWGGGNGVHARYFMDKGFDSYCVDIVDGAVEQAKKRLGYPDRCRVVAPDVGARSVFPGVTFDVIFCNQSLYYLTEPALKKLVADFYDIANEGCIFFATMMSNANGYAQCVTRKLENGLSEVVVKGRLNETSYINFIENAEEMKSLFRPFRPLFIGDYVPFNLYDDGEGSSHHFIYIGQK